MPGCSWSPTTRLALAAAIAACWRRGLAETCVTSADSRGWRRCSWSAVRRARCWRALCATRRRRARRHAHRHRRTGTGVATDRRWPLPAPPAARMGAVLAARHAPVHAAPARSARRAATGFPRRGRAGPGAGGTRWEQVSFARRCGRTARTCCSHPATRRRSSARRPDRACIHDVSFAAHPEWFRLARGHCVAVS